MSIIKCYECKKDISNNAITCPHCGNPINIKKDSKIVEVEFTSKKWKKKFLLGMALFIIGWIMLYRIPILGILIVIGGIITVIIAGIGRWWTNG